MKAHAGVHETVIVGGDATALTAREVLGLLEAEGGAQAEITHLLPLPRRQRCLAGILDNRQVMLFPDREDGVHIERRPTDMHGQKYLGAGGDGRLHLTWIDLKTFGIDIHDNRQGMVHDHHVVGRYKGVDRQYHLIARANV